MPALPVTRLARGSRLQMLRRRFQSSATPMLLVAAVPASLSHAHRRARRRCRATIAPRYRAFVAGAVVSTEARHRRPPRFSDCPACGKTHSRVPRHLPPHALHRPRSRSRRNCRSSWGILAGDRRFPPVLRRRRRRAGAISKSGRWRSAARAAQPVPGGTLPPTKRAQFVR